MGTKMVAESGTRPEAGDVLLVIHEFIARSSDELSLAKGDRVVLLERDDEFGDGWFLGRHLANEKSVYTRPLPAALPPTATAGTHHSSQSACTPGSNGATNATTLELTAAFSSSSSTNGNGRPATSYTTSASKADSASVTLPLLSPKADTKSVAAPGSVSPANKQNRTFAVAPGTVMGSLGARLNHNQDSLVIHETLGVIDEHINDLHARPSHGALTSVTDSGSEYSGGRHERYSYIQGEETDEEEEAHTRAEVLSWNAEDVAEYLFTAGVEKEHCEVFRDQEISGEVLLEMDQSSLFLKAFELGSVGRRLKTWQKVKSLQDEVNGPGPLSRRTTQMSEAGSEGSRQLRSRSNTLTHSQRQLDDRSGSVQGRRLSQTTRPEHGANASVAPKHGSPTPTHQRRPSAASIRDLHHSRRHSSTDYRHTGTSIISSISPQKVTSVSSGNDTTMHRKQPSFDRNWSMGGAFNGASNAPHRPLSSADLHDVLIQCPDTMLSESPELDRGYFSGTEVDGRRRSTLKKSDSMTATSHRSNVSFAGEQRRQSGSAVHRHSRFGSVDSGRDVSAPPSNGHKYFGLPGTHRRNISSSTTDSVRPVPPSKNSPPPATKLDAGRGERPPSAGSHRRINHPDWGSKSVKSPSFSGLRAISDAVTGGERAKFTSNTDGSPTYPPSRTGSSTPSAGPSFELDSPDTVGKSPLSTTTAGSARKPAKTKKETSAYLRGLAKIGPRDAVKAADYSGWMKKKNSHLMTTWKPRLFVLKGRRLAYFYSEDDTEEKGLIDISFHRVLPADHDRLTGLHATLTGASNSPMMPADSSLQTEADGSSKVAVEKGDEGMFIFKLVPPRAGLSRAVTFTKPTVHYFAVPNLAQGRAWMAALMKATIDRDESKPMTSTYQQKTISLSKARQMRIRPPALMNLDENAEDGPGADGEKKNGLGISFGGADSAVSGLEKSGPKMECAPARKATFDSEKGPTFSFITSPQSA